MKYSIKFRVLAIGCSSVATGVKPGEWRGGGGWTTVGWGATVWWGGRCVGAIVGGGRGVCGGNNSGGQQWGVLNL